MPDGGLDFVLAAYRDEGRWRVEPLPDHLGGDFDELIDTLGRYAGTAVGLVSVDDDFFVAARVVDADVRLLLSDVTAAAEWPLARAVLQRLGLPVPDEEERVQPAGDLSIFADLGVPPESVAAICDDLDLYPDDMLEELADRMGFGDEFAAALDAALGET